MHTVRGQAILRSVQNAAIMHRSRMVTNLQDETLQLMPLLRLLLHFGSNRRRYRLADWHVHLVALVHAAATAQHHLHDRQPACASAAMELVAGMQVLTSEAMPASGLSLRTSRERGMASIVAYLESHLLPWLGFCMRMRFLGTRHWSVLVLLWCSCWGPCLALQSSSDG